MKGFKYNNYKEFCKVVKKIKNASSTSYEDKYSAVEYYKSIYQNDNPKGLKVKVLFKYFYKNEELVKKVVQIRYFKNIDANNVEQSVYVGDDYVVLY